MIGYVVTFLAGAIVGIKVCIILLERRTRPMRLDTPEHIRTRIENHPIECQCSDCWWNA